MVLVAVVGLVGVALAVAAAAWSRAAATRAEQEGRTERTSGIVGGALSALDKLLKPRGEKE